MGKRFAVTSSFKTSLPAVSPYSISDEIGAHPKQETLSDYITTKAAFLGADGTSTDAYTSFVDSMESNPRTSQGLLIVVLEEDYRINQIGSVLSGPGYLLPAEAISQTNAEQPS